MNRQNQIRNRIYKMEDEIIILRYLAGIPKYEGNKNFISGATGDEIQKNTNLSPEIIKKVVKKLYDNNLVKSIPDSSPNNTYKFFYVCITDKGFNKYIYLPERIDDWKKRISNLYTLVNHWLIDQQGYTMKTNNTVNMYEELMQEYEIEKQSIDVADIFKHGKLILSIKPVGLWIIGANGRVDLITKNDSFIMVDVADWQEDPKWTIFKSNDRRNGQIFSKEIFYELIGN